MFNLFNLKSRRGNGRRGGRRQSADEDEDEHKRKAYSLGPLIRHRLRLSGLTLLFATAVVFICFVGQEPPTVGTLGEVAPQNIYSDRNFKYTSEVLRRDLEAWTRTSTPLEYSRDFAGEEGFAKALVLLNDRLVANMGKVGESLSLARDALREELMVTFGVELAPDEIRMLGLIRNELGLRSIFDETTETLGHLHATGVLIDPSSDQKFLSEANATLAIAKRMSETASNLPVIGGVDAGLELLFDMGPVRIRFPHFANFISEVRTRIEEDGPFPPDGLNLGDVISTADSNTSGEAMQLRDEFGTVFAVLAEQGLFLRSVDRAKTVQAQDHKIAAIQPDKYEVGVSEGDVILRKGDEVSEGAMEKYKRLLDLSADESDLLARRILLTCTTFLCSLLYISLVLPNFWRSGAKTGIVATAVLGNLLLSRGVIELGGTDLFGGNPLLVGMLPYLLPVAFSSMVVMITVGPRMGAVAALMTSTFHAAMQDTGVESLVISLGASLMGAFFCRDVRLRGSALKAGTMSGVVAAVFAIAIGLIAGSTLTSIFNHGVAALLTGLVTGGLVLGPCRFLNVFSRWPPMLLYSS